MAAGLSTALCRAAIEYGQGGEGFRRQPTYRWSRDVHFA
jgi:hypothetical protein